MLYLGSETLTSRYLSASRRAWHTGHIEGEESSHRCPHATQKYRPLSFHGASDCSPTSQAQPWYLSWYPCPCAKMTSSCQWFPSLGISQPLSR